VVDLKVFLGGTCNESNWRERLIPKLTINYFNPVVSDWNEKAQEEEIKQRETCDYCLYVISPKMTGVYSIAEVIDDANKRPEKTVFCVLESDTSEDGKSLSFSQGQLKSLNQVGKLVQQNGGIWLPTLNDVAEYLNSSCDGSCSGN